VRLSPRPAPLSLGDDSCGLAVAPRPCLEDEQAAPPGAKGWWDASCDLYLDDETASFVSPFRTSALTGGRDSPTPAGVLTGSVDTPTPLTGS
jgi:hypothetical protein